MPRGDFQLVTHPDRAPAVDFITRSSEGPFVDTGLDVILRSRPGDPVRTERVYLAKSTIEQLALLAGVEGNAEFSAQREAELKAQGKLEGLKEGLGDDLASVAHSLGRWLDAAGISRGRGSRS